MRMKTLFLPALLPTLAFLAGPLAAQPQEASLTMGVGVQFTLPAGWQAESHSARLSVWAEEPAPRAVTVVLYSEAGKGAPGDDPVLAGALDRLELRLPDTAAPCAVGLADPLEALITPEAIDGMREYRRFGLGLTVPEAFEPIEGPPDELVLVLGADDGEVQFELVAELLSFRIERNDLELDFGGLQIIDSGEMRLGDGMLYERFDMRFVDEQGGAVEGSMLIGAESRDGWAYLHVSLFHRADDPALAAIAARILEGL
ncbi:MAG: hypothetical protein JJT95_03085 [Pararhodobacter sp.]|nr:hypothetical protein [Pararhodobacter sp.]